VHDGGVIKTRGQESHWTARTNTGSCSFALMAYSIHGLDLYRRLANIIDKILRGANPGDIPIYQHTKFAMVIGLKTAKALGLEMPAMLLGRADEVID
jgi:putative ABC transport system substrate-binding protein